MKKLTLFLLLLCTCALSFGADFASEIQLTLKAMGVKRGAENALYQNPKTNNTAEKVAAYLFNMYVRCGMEGSFKIPEDALDISSIGVLDPAFGLPHKNITLYEADYDHINTYGYYDDNEAAVRTILKNTFKQKLGLDYDDNSKEFFITEADFMDALYDSTFYRMGYLNNPAFQSEPVDNMAKKQIKKLYDISKLQDEGCRSCYIGYDGNTRNEPLCNECALNSYALSRLVEKGDKFNGWEVINIYELIALNKKQGYPLKKADGDEVFKSYDGHEYGMWGFHETTLLVLKKGNTLSYVAMDKMLFSHPVYIQNWVKYYDEETIFIIKPFEQNKDTESMIVKLDGSAFFN